MSFYPTHTIGGISVRLVPFVIGHRPPGPPKYEDAAGVVRYAGRNKPAIPIRGVVPVAAPKLPWRDKHFARRGQDGVIGKSSLDELEAEAPPDKETPAESVAESLAPLPLPIPAYAPVIRPAPVAAPSAPEPVVAYEVSDKLVKPFSPEITAIILRACVFPSIDSPCGYAESSSGHSATLLEHEPGSKGPRLVRVNVSNGTEDNITVVVLPDVFLFVTVK